MKKIVGVIKSSLVIRIIIGLIIGIALALLCPSWKGISIFGDVFVGALKAIAPVLVFILVICSLANAGAGIGKRFRTVIILYLVSTFLAAIVAVAASFIFPTQLALQGVEKVDQTAVSGLGEVFHSMLMKIVENPVTAIGNANYLGVLSWAVVFGLALKKLANDVTKKVLQDISNAVTKAVSWVINLAPFGIMGIVFGTVSEQGLGVFSTYGHLLLVLVGSMLAVALIVDPLIAAICLRKNPYPLVLRCFKESGLTAFFTRSSAANIPVNMRLCEKLGLDKEVYSVSIPLGATINMDGAAITITVMTLAAAHTMGIAVSLPMAILLSIIASLGACGASGVAGGSLLLIPMACALFGIDNGTAMQVVGVGFLIGVVQDSLETAINSSGDVLFAATAEFMEWRKEGRSIKF